MSKPNELTDKQKAALKAATKGSEKRAAAALDKSVKEGLQRKATGKK
jgi:hypothetical protein